MKHLIQIILFSILSLGLYGQKRTVSGKVVYGRDPLPAVRVIEKGTVHGTITDINGEFSLEIPEGKEVILLFSYMGPTIEKKIKKNDTYIRVNLQMKTKRLYVLAGASFMKPDSFKTLSEALSLGYNYQLYRFGLGGELSLVPVRNINSTHFQLGIPLYGSIRLTNRLRGLLGAGYYWSLSNSTTNNDVKIQGGILYRKESVALDLRYCHGVFSISRIEANSSKNLTLGIRFYIGI